MIISQNSCDDELATQLVSLDELCFDMPWNLSSISEELNHPDALNFYVFDGESSLTGASLARIISDELWILRIMIHPTHRGRGYAKQLLIKQLNKAEELGIKKCLLEVRTDNLAAINLYRSCGFEIISTRKDYYECKNNTRADAYVMQRI